VDAELDKSAWLASTRDALKFCMAARADYAKRAEYAKQLRGLGDSPEEAVSSLCGWHVSGDCLRTAC
jgi:hypothetical protein